MVMDLLCGRGDALDGTGATELIAALTSVTFSIRALNELEPAGLKTAYVRRILVGLCRAALVNDDMESVPLAGLSGTRHWLEALVG